MPEYLFWRLPVNAVYHQRVKKMEDAGIIEGSRFIVKPRALGFKICAFIGVILDNASQYKKVVKEIEKIPEVIECHFITGHYSFFLKIRCNSHQHLMDILINTLQNIPGIAKIFHLPGSAHRKTGGYLYGGTIKAKRLKS